jgi:protein phosphatase
MNDVRGTSGLTGVGKTVIGASRSHNEDALKVRDDLGLFSVADGAGGHNAGDVAAFLALRSIENYVGATVRTSHERAPIDRFGAYYDLRRISAAVHKANRDVFEVSKSSERHRGMGTTIVTALYSTRTGHLHVAHVGDSRCYRLRNGILELLTVDHSVLTDILEQRPELDDTIMEQVPQHAVTRALGLGESIRVSLSSHQVVSGDRYLLCSDGILRCISELDLKDLMATAGPLQPIVDEIIGRVQRGGGRDDATGLLIECAPDFVAISPQRIAPTSSADDGPELMIDGIEELEDWLDTADDDLVEALSDWVDKRRKR